jgi:uncharacterized membrane protein (UPF0136 family)
MIIVFAFVLLAGGVMGYIKAGSILSLGMSAVSASLLILCATFGLKGKYGALVTAGLLIIALDFFFIYRVIKTGKMMPGGVMAILCTVVCIPLLSFLKKQVYEQSEN